MSDELVGHEVFSLIMASCDALCDGVHMFWVWGLSNHFVHYFIVTELCTIFGS